MQDLIKTDIKRYLKEHENKAMCRFITCGSVDDGKSTLIGRMLYDSKVLFEDQLSALEKDSAKVGTQGENIDFALLVDGLSSEREQGITIDVAYRFFTTEKKKYIIADTPGHEQYTRNMATGASSADVAIILLDARKGVLTQTKRHSYIVSLLGIKKIIVAVNKMDLVDYSQSVFEKIVTDYREIISKLPNFGTISFDFLPLSALCGDNILQNSHKMQWYKGKALLPLLDSYEFLDSNLADFRMPVQYVNRPHLNFRGFCGSVASGSVSVGDSVVILPQNKTSKVKEIITPEISDLNARDSFVSAKSAEYPQAITLTLEDEIDISRGDIIASGEIPSVAKNLKVNIVWMSEIPLKKGVSYVIKRATSVLYGEFSEIFYKKDINTLEEVAADSLELNDIAQCALRLDRNLCFETYENNRTLGSFIIIDKYTNETLGAGMIVESLSGENVESKQYSQAEIELNAYIRKFYPEWECKAI
ncbi:MAG: sulfate adenylyltransferase subunit CysN [Helicobacter sp.]|nr:sulfate adenylyltransferase subunit CysN [Helicobacter sp.]